MLFIYRILINLVILISPIIITLRLIIKKENFFRFKEKFCFFSQKKLKGRLIWFHGASVGELQSIFPLLEKLEKKNEFDQILVTSNTLSSSKIMEKLKSKKIIHQFFPIDTNLLTKKFLDYWKPSFVFFIDSEIWPNMIYNLKKKNVPMGLINGRITKKTFIRWSKIPNFSKNIFENFKLCLSSSNESKKYLKKLGVKNVKFIGNLKFSQSENEKNILDTNLKKFLKSRKVWCASSTHKTEEYICGKVHKSLKKKYKNLLTIIIPRHIHRVKNLDYEIKNLNLKTALHSSKPQNLSEIDIYIVDTFGETQIFHKLGYSVFLGGSIIKRGGQNPLEAARYDANILHGPNVDNFKDVYKLLNKFNIAKKINSPKELAYSLIFKKNKNQGLTIKNIGKKILKKTLKELDSIIKNDFKKT